MCMCSMPEYAGGGKEEKEEKEGKGKKSVVQSNTT